LDDRVPLPLLLMFCPKDNPTKLTETNDCGVGDPDRDPAVDGHVGQDDGLELHVAVPRHPPLPPVLRRPPGPAWRERGLPPSSFVMRAAPGGEKFPDLA